MASRLSLIKLNRLAVGIDRILVLLLLLVGVAQRRVELGGAGRIRDGAQHFAGARGVAFFVVEIGERGDSLFGIRIQLDRGLELAFRLLQIVVQAIEAAEQKVVIDVVGFDLDDLLVLLDSQLENVLRALARPECRPAIAR